jgi:hypothetical protein
MRYSKHIQALANKTAIYFLLVLTLMMITLPVLANTRNWGFTGTVAGLYINGEHNGVYHNMTAGNLTNSGSLWSRNWAAYPLVNWSFRVWKDNGLFGDQAICTTTVAPNPSTNVPVYFSQSCGYVSAGNYYLEAWRNASDDRAYSASGSFVTP